MVRLVIRLAIGVWATVALIGLSIETVMHSSDYPRVAAYGVWAILNWLVLDDVLSNN